MFSRHRVHKRIYWTTNQLRSMRAIIHFTGLFSEHKEQYHELYCTHLHFNDFGLRSLFVFLMCFPSCLIPMIPFWIL